ncbi:AAA family ATPase [Streptomyces cavernicola]|uniref:ATP-binding protein n=1 Tax=Streptomyces cavernicola TaxID=3043613 RepID=A0ABT6S2T9_9ACTN|nr:ATP-binding protein [Streptomyces sp. B-S-A6]MDI3402419.1 ATP-binding protein [Streptomyces sp. B-S-A6]
MTVREEGNPQAVDGSCPAITELRLSAYKSHRGTTLPLAPVTLLDGPSGSGKSSALQAYEALARLGHGRSVYEAFPDAVDCVPDQARPDRQRRRGFRIGCTAEGPAGPVRLDVAVQAEPDLRIVGERLSAGGGAGRGAGRGGGVLFETALRDPSTHVVQAAWHTAGTSAVTRAPLPDDRLGTAMVPLRVAGSTDAQRRVLQAAEQVVVALRSAFPCDPLPERMRATVRVGEGLLRPGCDNLAEVLRRTRAQCEDRHAALVGVARAGCAGPVVDVTPQVLDDGTVRGVLERGPDRVATPLGRLGDGELRFLALALVLLTGPGVRAADPAGAAGPAGTATASGALTVLADGFARGLDEVQARRLVELAVRCAGSGGVRLVAAVSGASWACGVAGAEVVDLRGD